MSSASGEDASVSMSPKSIATTPASLAAPTSPKSIASTQATDRGSPVAAEVATGQGEVADDSATSKLVEVVFEPGKLGIDFDVDTGRVHLVPDPDGSVDQATGKKINQAIMKGVKPAWILRTIDGQAYTWKLFKSKLKVTSKNVFPYKCGFEMPSHRLPRHLYVRSPNGQHDCNGWYDLVPHKYPNGNSIPFSKPNYKRMWKHREHDLWLYSSNSIGWTIAGVAAQKEHFNCTIGVISSVCGHANDIMPHELLGEWKRVNDDGRWVTDPAITVTTCEPQSWKRI